MTDRTPDPGKTGLPPIGDGPKRAGDVIRAALEQLQRCADCCEVFEPADLHAVPHEGIEASEEPIKVLELLTSTSLVCSNCLIRRIAPTWFAATDAWLDGYKSGLWCIHCTEQVPGQCLVLVHKEDRALTFGAPDLGGLTIDDLREHVRAYEGACSNCLMSLANQERDQN